MRGRGRGLAVWAVSPTGTVQSLTGTRKPPVMFWLCKAQCAGRKERRTKRKEHGVRRLARGVSRLAVKPECRSTPAPGVAGYARGGRAPFSIAVLWFLDVFNG